MVHVVVEERLERLRLFHVHFVGFLTFDIPLIHKALIWIISAKGRGYNFLLTRLTLLSLIGGGIGGGGDPSKLSFIVYERGRLF